MTRTSVFLRAVGGGLLTIGAAIGVVLLGAMVVGSFSGVRLVVITSGSMEPGIQTGALVLTRHVPAADLRVADVVMVTTSTGSRVTHRIVGIERSGDAAVLRLKGDANETADAEPYRVTEADRAVLDVPVVGRVLGSARSPMGLLGLGALGAVLLMFILRGGSGPPGGGRNRTPPATRRRAGGPAAAAVTLAVGAATQAAPASSSTAAWTDSVPVNATFGARTIDRPGPTACGVTGNAVTGFTATVTWAVQTSPVTMTYTAKLRQGGTLGVVTSAGIAQTQVTSGLLGALLGTTVHVDVVATLPGTSWTSPVRTRSLVVGLAGTSLTCGVDS